MVSVKKNLIQVLMVVGVAVGASVATSKMSEKPTVFEYQAQPQEIAFISSLSELKNKVDNDTAILTSYVRTRLKLDEKAVISYDIQRGVFTVNK